LTSAKIAGAGSVSEDRMIAARVQILSVTSDLSVPESAASSAVARSAIFSN
jgi:hypothetical protein